MSVFVFFCCCFVVFVFAVVVFFPKNCIILMCVTMRYMYLQ